MDIFLILLCIIIIFICIYYFSTQTKKELNTVERFGNWYDTTSPYYKNNIDQDMKSIENKFQGIFGGERIISFDRNKQPFFNGTWAEQQGVYNYQLFQNNDNLIIFINKLEKDPQKEPYSVESQYNCVPDIFVGLCQLNEKRNGFVLIDIMCNNLETNDFNLQPESFLGKVEKVVSNEEGFEEVKIHILSSKNGTNYPVRTLTKTSSNTTGESELYLKSSSFINPLPTIPLEESKPFEITCKGQKDFCRLRNVGLGVDARVCGIKEEGSEFCRYDASDTKFDLNNISCIVANEPLTLTDPETGLQRVIPGCTQSDLNMNVKLASNNIMPTNVLTTMKGSDLYVCNVVSELSRFNVFLVFYVENLDNPTKFDIRSLGYDFFGTQRGDSSLTTEHTKFTNLIYQNVIKKQLEEVKDKIKTPSELTDSERDKVNFIAKSYGIETSGITFDQICLKLEDKMRVSHRKVPATGIETTLWQFQKSYTSNGCLYTLNTNVLDNTVQKFAEFNSDGSTSMSLFKGGVSQELFFESPIKLRGDERHIAIACNLRPMNQLFLAPGNNSNMGFGNRSNIVSLKSQPEKKGFWLVIGLTANNGRRLEQTIKDALQ